MKDLDKFSESMRQVRRLVAAMFGLFMLMVGILLYLWIDPTLSAFAWDKEEDAYVTSPETENEDYDKIENGIHVRTGFVEGEGLMLVVNNCTNCHSAKLVTQNRMSKERWTSTIRWMQETQNLWDLGKNEEPIVNYLATYYAPIKKGRRQNLENIEWYDLDD